MKTKFLFISVLLVSLFLMKNHTAKADDSVRTEPAVTKTAPQKRKKPSQVTHFQGVGNKKHPDTGFTPQTPSPQQKQKDSDGVKLPENLQKIVDSVGKTVKDIDNATLKAVNSPLQSLGIEADQAQIRPQSGGIGLNVSIKLKKGGEEKKNPDEQEKERLKSLLPVEKGPSNTP